MKNLTNKELKQIKAGFSLTATFLNYFNDLITLLRESGRSIGSALRRVGSDSICPIK